MSEIVYATYSVKLEICIKAEIDDHENGMKILNDKASLLAHEIAESDFYNGYIHCHWDPSFIYDDDEIYGTQE